MERDGNGWVECRQGHRHWGRFGAAGLLVYSVTADGTPLVLLQHRAEWTHNGGTWGVPGGARDSHETAQEAALREAHEETALDTRAVTVVAVSLDDHGAWSYETVLAWAAQPLATEPNEESAELRWLELAAVDALPLHPGFARSWPRLSATARTLSAPWGRLHPSGESASE